ncbi:MAG: LysM peptidoglycan-binding domain-containing protein, partial [Lysinibacillus sp.]
MKKLRKIRILALSTIAASFFAIQTVEASTYTVQKGDTLSKIAKEHKISVVDLKKWNKLTADIIYVDQKLQVANTNGNTNLPNPPNSN